MVELTVESVRSTRSQQYAVVLKESQGVRLLVIWIGIPEASAIQHVMQHQSFARPLTHDLLKSAIERLGGTVTNVTINDLRQATYHSVITVEVGARRVEIDARPSDAIALALRAQCPIFVTEKVMDLAAVMPEEIGEPSRKDAPASDPSRQSSPSFEGLDIFREVIDGLDLDDFGD
jgi:uncharacterized protein